MTDKKPTYIDGVGWRYETEHTMTRRMAEHDYQSRCIYMITITTEGRRPILGTLKWTTGHPEDAHVERTPLGDEVAKCWTAISTHYHGVEPFPLMVMPDHVHGILFVTRGTECHLGQIVKGFKTGCNKAMRGLGVAYSETMSRKTRTETGKEAETETRREAGQETGKEAETETGKVAGQETGKEAETETGKEAGQETGKQMKQEAAPKKNKHPEHGFLFAPGYQDSILMSKGQLDRMFNYIADNPYRLAVKRENPNLFRVVSELNVEGMTFAAIGNRWLLNKPLRMQVRCHNNTTPENLRLIEKQKEYFLDKGRKGGVVVSPCISPGEKAVARAALDAEVPLVVILENGFPPMYKPPGKYFDACAKGLLLMLAPWPYHMERRSITRNQCLALNEMAYKLSTEPWTPDFEALLARR